MKYASEQRPQRGARSPGLHKLEVTWPGKAGSLILYMLDRDEARSTVRTLERDHGCVVEWNDFAYSTWSSEGSAVTAAVDWSRFARPIGLTEARARELAKGDRHYVARQNKVGEWIVWDTVSDHRVEFDQ